MDLEIIILSEVNQTKTNIIWYHLYVGPKIWHMCVFSTVDFLSFLYSEPVGSDNTTFPPFCPVPRQIADLPQTWGQQLLPIIINNLVTSTSVLLFQPYNICEAILHNNTPLFKMPIVVSIALIVNKRVWNAVLGCSLKNDRMIFSFPRQTIQYHSNPSLVMLKKLKLNGSMKT